MDKCKCINVELFLEMLWALCLFIEARECYGAALVFLFPLQFLLDNKLSGVRCVRHLEHNYAAPEQGEVERERRCVAMAAAGLGGRAF